VKLGTGVKMRLADCQLTIADWKQSVNGKGKSEMATLGHGHSF
jgi:hypothetical protein